MKITDLRCGRVFEGDLVDKIPGNSAMSDEQLEAYLGVVAGDTQYQHLKRPNQHKTAVLRNPAGGYWVIPINEKFFKVEQ